MASLDEIERAIENLKPEEFSHLADWIRALDQRRWDEQLDRDSIAGRLDFLKLEAKAEGEKGRLRDWPRET